MKHLALKALLGVGLLTVASIIPTTANSKLTAEPNVDGITCATPPERPTKKQTPKPTKKQKKTKKESKKSKTVAACCKTDSVKRGCCGK